MKKIILKMLPILILIAISINSYSTNYTRQQLLSYDKITQRQLFHQMTNDAKYSIWIDKMNQVLNVSIWNQNQTNMLVEMKSNMNIDIFNYGSQQNLTFASFEMDWILRSKGVFTLTQLKKIFIQIDDFDNSTNFMPAGGGSSNECGCSTGSDYCDPWGMNWGRCVSGGCNASSEGCGTFWTHPCNGNCGAGRISPIGNPQY